MAEQLHSTINIDNVSIPVTIEPAQELIVDDGVRLASPDVMTPISDVAIEAHRKHDMSIHDRYTESQSYLEAVSERVTQLHETFIDLADAETTNAEKTLENRIRLIEASRELAIASINQMSDRELQKEAVEKEGRVSLAKNAKEQAERFRTRAQSATQKLGADLDAVAEIQTVYEGSRDIAIGRINGLLQQRSDAVAALADAQEKHAYFSNALQVSNRDEVILLEERRTIRYAEMTEREELSEEQIQALYAEFPSVDGVESEALIEAKKRVYAGVDSIQLMQIKKDQQRWDKEWREHQDNAENIASLIDQYELSIETITTALETIPGLIADAQRTLHTEQTVNARKIEVFSVGMRHVTETYNNLLNGDITKVLQDSAPEELRFVVEELEKTVAAIQAIDEHNSATPWIAPTFDSEVPYPLRQKTLNDEADDSDNEPQTFEADQKRIQTMQQFNKDIPVNILDEMKRPIAFVSKIGRSVLKPGTQIEYSSETK